MANTGKYLSLTAGVIQEELALQVSAGAGDAGKIIRLDSAGLLPVTMLPSGVGAEAISVVTSEIIAAGAYVNLWNSTGLKARNADASVAGKDAVGFCLVGGAAAATVTVYLASQANNATSGRTVGARQFLSTTPGASQETAPAATGNVVQQLGFAVSATNVLFNPLAPITVA